jgi:uncharacterized RDD family membrane protein YckC
MEEKEIRWISGFWRRIGAFIIDAITLGIVGMGLGLALEKQFVELGGWGRIVGFIIALLYFGILNSTTFNGQTLGKKIFNIKVVNINNDTISILRSFTRYSILGIPFFLNNANFTANALTSYWIYPLSLILFGGIAAIIYLYIFNRTTRQSLHDLIVGTYVVNADVEKHETGSIWKPHIFIVGALFVIAGTVPAFTSNLTESESFKGLLSTQEVLTQNPNVSYTLVSYGYSTYNSAEGKTTTTYVSAILHLKHDTVNDKELAKNFAQTVINHYSDSLEKDLIQITLSYGYDIGIASKWSYNTFNFEPNELVKID